LIAKFNFYDVYGYFLPGLVLLTLLWLPFGMAYGRWPSGELVTALMAIPLAYVAGHVLQIFAIRVFPSTTKLARFPSDVILDETNTIFSTEFKTRLAAQIKSQFGLDVHGDPATVSRQRNDALFLCRSALIKAKTASYGEQFEGMYSLMRGLTLAFLLGAAHIAGSSLTFITSVRPWVLPCLLGALCVAIAIEFWQSAPPVKPARGKAVASLVMLVLALVCAGYGLAQDQAISVKSRYFLVGGVLIAVLLSRKVYQAYRFFTWEFAKAVYRDFATYEKPSGDEKNKAE
jgi:hypothetical protein